MSRITIREAVAMARRDLLPIEGVVAVGSVDDAIVVYVETAEVAGRLPSTYRGFPVIFKVTGRVVSLT